MIKVHYNLLFTLVSLTMVHSVCGQAYTSINGGDPQGGGALRYRIMPQDEDVEGSALLFEDWGNMQLVKRNGVKVFLDKANYNSNSESLVFMSNGKQFEVSDQESIEQFIFEGQTFLGFLYKGRYVFFKLHVDGELKLLSKVKTTVRKGSPSKGYIAGTKDKYISNRSYYSSQMNYVSLLDIKKEESILKLMADKKEIMSKYISDNRLKTKKLNDLIEIFTYYNRLEN